jgi:hypothetical protein
VNPASTIARYSRRIHLGEPVEIGLVPGVVAVGQEPTDLTRSRRRHEDFRDPGAGGGLAQGGDVALDGRPVLPLDGAGAGGATLERRRELTRHLGPLGKLVGVTARQRHALAVEAAQAILDVNGVVDAALLAVADDRQPRLALLAHHVAHGRPYPRVHGRRVDRPAFLALAQRGHEVPGPRQAARVDGEDTVGAARHQT